MGEDGRARLNRLRLITDHLPNRPKRRRTVEH
jgi:hypothetical protein